MNAGNHASLLCERRNAAAPKDFTFALFQSFNLRHRFSMEFAKSRIAEVLRENIGKFVSILTRTGIEQHVTVLSVDDEGFAHTLNGEMFWTALDDIAEVSTDIRE